MATESSSQKDLIRCIESEDIGGVADALARGANPNTRKKIVLTCKVSTGIFKSETRTDTAQAESALALAVRAGNLEIAELLLSAGVDPNWGVDWRVAGTYITWNQEDWNRRWYWNFTYPSMLCFAIGRGASVTGWDGGESRWQHDADKGKVLASKPGYEVKLNSPSSGSEVFEVEKIDPNPAMVILLLNYGANITPSVLESYWALGDHALIHILERTMMHRIAALRARVSELELRNEDVSKTLKRIQDKKTARTPSPVQARDIVPLEESGESSSEGTPKHPLQESDEKSSGTPPKFTIPALTLTEPTVVLGAPSAPKRALNLPRRVASAGAGAAPEHRPDAEAERLSKVLSTVGEGVPAKAEEIPERNSGKDSDVVQNSAARAQ